MNILLQLSIVAVVVIAVAYIVLNQNDAGMFDSLKSLGGIPTVKLP